MKELAGRRRLVGETRTGARGQLVLRGFNVSGYCKVAGTPSATRETARALLTKIAADGFNLIRLPVIWERLSRAIDDELVWFVNEANRCGLLVLVDLHQDLLGSAFAIEGSETYHGTGFPTDLLRRAYNASSPKPTRPFELNSWRGRWAWQQNYTANTQLHSCWSGLLSTIDEIRAHAARVSALFRTCENVLGFEVINEPMPPFVGDRYQQLFRALAPILSEGGKLVCAMPAADWLYVSPKVPWFVSHVSAVRPGCDPREMPGWSISTPHVYDAVAMAAGQRPWLARFARERSYGRMADIIDAWHRSHDLPYVVGEFGVPANIARAPRLTNAWVTAFETRAMSWCAWNLNPEAVDFDDHWCGERMSLVRPEAGGLVYSRAYEAMLRPMVVASAGELTVSESSRERLRASIGPASDPAFSTVVHVPPALGEFAVSPVGAARIDGRTITFAGTDRQLEIDVSCPQA